jgi:TetR/AcrR family transcriptional regulator, tetracycline repressor protein
MFMSSTTKKRSPAESANLSRSLIAEMALSLIDRDGLDNFSVRNLANELGVFPAAIYWHIPNKNAMLGEALNVVYEDLVIKRGRRTWQRAVKDLLVNFRRALSRHPNMAPLVSARLASNAAEEFGVTEYMLSLLVDAGFADAELVQAYNTAICSMVSFAALEFAAAPQNDVTKWQLEVQRRLIDVDPAKFPILATNKRRLANKAFVLRWENGIHAPLDDSFGFYVDTFVAGLEAQLSASVEPERRNPSMTPRR